jgi:hypothetical protein
MRADLLGVELSRLKGEWRVKVGHNTWSVLWSIELLHGQQGWRITFNVARRWRDGGTLVMCAEKDAPEMVKDEIGRMRDLFVRWKACERGVEDFVWVPALPFLPGAYST